MAHQSAVIDCYEQIVPLVARMLELARTGNWDALVTLEAQFRADIERLKVLDPADTLDQSQLEQKHRMLKRILADDAEIRNLISPQLARLGAFLGSMHQQQNLQQTYGR